MPRLVRFAAASAFLAASTSLAGAVATVTVTPTLGGPPTTQVTVTIRGFAVRKLVDVYFDSDSKCVLITNAKGGGACVFRSPATAQPGTHWVTAAVRATGSGAQKPFLVRTDWTDSHGQNAEHSGFNRFENTISPKNVHLLTPVWTVLSNLTISSTPVVHRGRLLVGASDGKLHAFNATTGAVIAGFPKALGSPIDLSSPVAANGIAYQVVVEPGGDARLHAVGVADGKTVAGFQQVVGFPVFAAPVVVGGKVYVGNGIGKVFGFDARTGAVATGFPVSVPGAPAIASTMAFSGGRLFFGATDGKFYALDPATRSLTVLFTAGTFDLDSPAVSNGLVVTTNRGDGKLYALAAATGARIWPSDPVVGTPTDGSPAIAGGRVFTAAASKLIASDVAMGTTVWSLALGPANGTFGSVTVANGVVFTGAHSGIYAADAETGSLLWQARGSLGFSQSIPIANGMIYAPGIGGKGITAYAIRGASDLSVPTAARPAISELKPDLSLKP
jgi:outer membrane protein assembly factor BamB